MYEMDFSNEMFNNKNINNEEDFEQFIDKQFSKGKSSNLFKKPEFSNPFKEYFSRGMLECTGSYLAFIAKMHVLMREVYEKFYNCQKNVFDKETKENAKANLFEETLAKYKLDPESIKKIVKERKFGNIKE